MPIIYTYPVKSTANDNDLILISDSQDSNKTKQIKIGDLPGGSSSGVSSVTATLPVVSSGGNTPVISLKDLTGFGTAGQVIKVNSGADGLEWGAAGGSTSPDAPTNSVQFNNAGAFGGSANLTFSTNTLAVTHTVDIKGDGTNAGKLKLYCENTSTPHAITIEGPAHSGGADYTLKFPSGAPGTSQILEYENSTNNLRWIATPTSSGATPAATPTGGVQYNDGSNGFAASANITIGGTPNVLTVKNIVQTRGDGTNAGKFKIWSNDNLKHVSIEGPPNGGTDYELKMPNAVGTANQVLKLPSTIPGSGASQLVWSGAVNQVTAGGVIPASSGAPLIVLPSTGNVVVTSASYAGTTNVGHVPAGGSNTTFLRGDGTWVTPSGGGGISFSGTTANGIATYSNSTTANVSSAFTISGNKLSAPVGSLADPSIEVGAIGGLYAASGGILLAHNGANAIGVASSSIVNYKLTQFQAGLKFGATGETLNSYEEGTWTPTSANANTISSVAGDYTRIGDMVFAQFSFTMTGSTTVAISGLPFQGVYTSSLKGGVIISADNCTSVQGQLKGGQFTGTNSFTFNSYFGSGGGLPTQLRQVTASMYQTSGGTYAGIIIYETTAA